MAEHRDVTMAMTLGEIRLRDRDNFQLLYKACKPYPFDTEKEAMDFEGTAVNKALANLGVDQVAIINKWRRWGKDPKKAKDLKFIGEQVQKVMDANDVKPETRKYNDNDPFYISGFYIYHGNEIAYFISEPIEQKRSKSRDTHIILLNQKEYVIKTNVTM